MKPELKEELSKMTKQLDDRQAMEDKIMASSNRTLKRLSHKSLLDEPAKFLANICVELDAEYGVGTTLALDWMLDNYVAMEFERRAYPWFIDIWQALKDGKHTVKNQFDYSDGYEAFYIPHKTMKIVVMGSWWKYSGSKVLVMDNPGHDGYFRKFSVRKIWKRLSQTKWSVERPTLAHWRKKDFKLKYGDCRDPGHIMTYEKMSPAHAGKCDHVIWDLNEPIRWFFDVNILWTCLCFPEHDSGLTNPEDLEEREA